MITKVKKRFDNTIRFLIESHTSFLVLPDKEALRYRRGRGFWKRKNHLAF